MSDFLLQEAEREWANPPQPPRKLRNATARERLEDWYAGDPIGPRETKVITNAVARLVPPAEALSATITVETAAVRYTVDGTNPTAAVGTNVTVGSQINVRGRASLLGIAMFRATGVDATVQVEYFN